MLELKCLNLTWDTIEAAVLVENRDLLFIFVLDEPVPKSMTWTSMDWPSAIVDMDMVEGDLGLCVGNCDPSKVEAPGPSIEMLVERNVPSSSCWPTSRRLRINRDRIVTEMLFKNRWNERSVSQSSFSG